MQGPGFSRAPQRIPAPERTAWQGSGSFFFHRPPWPIIAVSREPFSLPPANFPFQDRVFCRAPSKAPLIVVNFLPEMIISGSCQAINICQIVKDGKYLPSGMCLAPEMLITGLSQGLIIRQIPKASAYL